LGSAFLGNILEVTPGELSTAVLQGGAGADVLQLLEGGTFDLTLPAVFISIESVLGSDESDTIILDQTRFAGVASFAGGQLPNARWDELVLRGATFDFTDKTVTGIDRLTLQSAGAVLIAPTKEIALLASEYAARTIGSRREASPSRRMRSQLSTAAASTPSWMRAGST
jgi:serralysin